MGLIDYNQLPNLDLFGIFFFHFVLSTWAVFGRWSPEAYTYYNAVLLFVLIWCIKDSNQNEIPLILAIRVNIISIIFDFLIIITCFPHPLWESLFSYLGGLFNLLLRFITIPLLSKLCSDKTGGLNDGLPSVLSPIFGADYGSTVRDPYENIDSVPHQSYPKSEPVITPPGASYSFTSNPPTYQA
ncbi:uncharacterized protein LOC135838906 [Planococcus citri]|uniref:uncharacterized protein LOC135838906 n=1 Tax=Planococcus citri TaxID=170843 RepID=UPI0031F8536E